MRVTAVIFVCLFIIIDVFGQEQEKSKDDLKKSKKFTKLGKKPTKLKSTTVDPDDIDTFDSDDVAEVTSEQTVSTTRAPVEPLNPKARLKQDLLKNYNKDIHPVKDWNNAVQVRKSGYL